MSRNEFFKETVAKNYGRRRGSLWRSEWDWQATDGIGKSHEDIRRELKEAELYSQAKNESLKSKTGMSRGKNMRYMGCIPASVYIAHPELSYDEKAVKKFFEDNPQYTIPPGKK